MFHSSKRAVHLVHVVEVIHKALRQAGCLKPASKEAAASGGFHESRAPAGAPLPRTPTRSGPPGSPAAAAGAPQAAGTWTWGGVYGGNWFVDPVNRISVVILTNTAIEGMVGAFTVAVRDAIYG